MLNNWLNNRVSDNFRLVSLRLLILPILILIGVVLLVLNFGSFTPEAYVDIQKGLFFYLNGQLSALPYLQFNLTQLGDVLIFLPLLTIFIVYAPKLWGVLLSSLIISAVVSFSLKKLFAIPRPAAMFDNDSFVIIGRTLSGSTSLPSGHSIATFVIITILLFAFMPQKLKFKIIWSIFILAAGLIIAFSRVGVGAHYPIDVVVGSAFGFLCSIIGITINNRYNCCDWIKNKKYYPIFMLVLVIWVAVLAKKIVDNNLLIFYFSIISISVTLYLMMKVYVQKRN